MAGNMKKIIMDVDDTITYHNSSSNYEEKSPRYDVIKKMVEYKELGYEIILFSARNMKTFNGDLSKINFHTLPILTSWLQKHNVPYDGIIMGKPWCGEDGFYVDDKSIRPKEFLELSEEEIKQLIK
ncbi:capsular biosynthesis protein [Aquirufa regiilacus]